MLEGITGVLGNLSNVFTFYNMVILLAGVLGGLVLGALPGISPTLAVALLVPFTFYMNPLSGLILLGAVYMASVAGGAISAILINVPGAPANIATMLDGYPMAKAGKARSALYTCFISSFMGGIFGMAVMILLTFPLAEFALRFRSVEIFWTAILGMTVVAGLGSGSVVKSLVAAAFGVWLSTIGPNPTTGEFRFVFHDALAGGINIIPALIGLFAIPQVFTLIENFGTERSGVRVEDEKGGLWRTFRKTAGMFRVQGMGAVIGSVIGLIPGVGGQVAGIVSYDQVKKYSRNPEKYGTGIAEGVAAAESANNAMVGPSLVPLLTLSIPGSPTAAVLLGGLLIHGIFPGPDLFRLHGNIVHSFIGSLLLAQFVMLVFGLGLSRYSGWIMKVDDMYMAASIIVLAVFGTYSVNNNFNEVLIMFAVGFLMYLGGRVGFSAAPVVMGLILGRIAENAFLKSMLIARAGEGMLKYFFTGWINVVIILLCVASLLFGVQGMIKGRVRKGRTVRDLHVSCVVLAFSLLVYFYGLNVRDPLSAIFPAATLLIMAGLAAVALLQSLYSLLKGKEEEESEPPLPMARIIGAITLVVLYFVALTSLGFYFSSFVFYFIFITVLMFRMFRKKDFLSPVLSRAFVAAAFVSVLYILFNVILNASPPKGLII
ncbi:MAG: tripartite tricarboxylate transporter permease [Nitrospirota bacterium]